MPSLALAPAEPIDAEHAERVLRRAVAFVWLATGVAVLHPAYRAEGARWLAPLGLGSWIMFATCAAEVALAAILFVRRTDRLQALAQTAPVLAFTVILAAVDLRLFAHPFGVLTKNIPIIASVWAAYLLTREGFGPRVDRALRIAAGAIWITEGLFPKLLFQQPLELEVLRHWGLAAPAASTLVRLTGAAQIACGILVFTLRGRPLHVLTGLLLGALVALPILVTVPMPEAWVHPFGPLTKNVVILAATYVLWRRCKPISS